jgi:Transposase DDE domain/Domain of unknown function (DUF4372)
MHQGKYIFAQIMDFFNQYELDKCVKRYNGDKKVRKLSCRDQFLAMIFGQLANLASLRGIIICLNAHAGYLYHLGFKAKKFVLTTLTRANEKRDWRIYRDLAQVLMDNARKFYANDNDFAIELAGVPYVIDSSIIELCLSTFKWADYSQWIGGIKIHTQLDLRGNIPSFFLITEAIIQDWDFLDIIDFEKNAYYIMDKGYYDFNRLCRIHSQSAYFIIRAKKNISAKRIYSKRVDKPAGVRYDQTIRLTDYKTKKKYSEKLRRIKYYDQTTDKYYIFLTNNFQLEAKTVADLYHCRWQIELFFKWIKQHLHVEVFWGCSANAVKTQICIAMCAFLLVAIMKKKLGIDRNLYEILQILNVSLFDKILINTLLSEFNLMSVDEQTQKRLFSLNF